MEKLIGYTFLNVEGIHAENQRIESAQSNSVRSVKEWLDGLSGDSLVCAISLLDTGLSNKVQTGTLHNDVEETPNGVFLARNGTGFKCINRAKSEYAHVGSIDRDIQADILLSSHYIIGEEDCIKGEYARNSRRDALLSQEIRESSDINPEYTPQSEGWADEQYRSLYFSIRHLTDWKQRMVTLAESYS